MGIGTTTSVASGFSVTTNASAGNQAIDTTTKRSGAGSYKTAPSTNVPGYFRWNYTTTTLGTGIYARAFIRLGNLPTATVVVMRIADSAAASIVSARLTSAGKLQFWREVATAAQIGSDSAATLTTGQWYRIEIYCKTDTGATDDGELRIDGVTVASTTAQTWTDNGLSYMDSGWVGGPGASNLTLYVDDVGINDNTGTSQNTWVGDTKIVALWPVADISRVGWVAGAGATTSLFDAVDNHPPTGVALGSATNTSQIKDLANNQTDTYVFEVASCASAGIDKNAHLNHMQPYATYSGDAAGSTAIRLTITANPVGPTGANQAATVVSAAGVWPSDWFKYRDTGIVDPSLDISSRTQVTLLKRTASATLTQMVAGMALAVDYSPGNNAASVVSQAVGRASTR